MQYRRFFKKATVDRLEHRRDLQDKKKNLNLQKIYTVLNLQKMGLPQIVRGKNTICEDI